MSKPKAQARFTIGAKLFIMTVPLALGAAVLAMIEVVK